MEKKVLIIIRIIQGFGDVVWGCRLLSLLQSKYTVTLLFINCMKKQLNYLQQDKNYKLIEISTEEAVKKFSILTKNEAIFYTKEEEIADSKIIELTDVFDKILNFHFDTKNPIKHQQIINFDEYGKNSQVVRFLNEDFDLKYPESVILENNILKIFLEPLDFKKKFNFSESEFSVQKISKLIDTPFYFSYFSSQNPVSDILSFFYFLKKLTEFSQYKNFTVLSNFDFSNLIENTELENISTLIKEELKNGVTDKYYNLFYIKEIENFNLSFRTNLEVEFNGIKINVLNYPTLSSSEFNYLLLKSEDIVGCTGDMSITLTISSKRIFFYQTLAHKLNFRNLLIESFNNFFNITSSPLQEIMFDPKFIKPIKKIENIEIFKKDIKKWYEYLENFSFENWINKKLKD